jgi:hypothetical protein
MSGGDYSLILLPDVPSGVRFRDGIRATRAWAAMFGHSSSVGLMEANLLGQTHTGRRPAGGWRDCPGLDVLSGRAHERARGTWFLGIAAVHFPGRDCGVAELRRVSFGWDGLLDQPQGAGYSRFSVTYADVHDYLENLPAAEVLPAKSSIGFSIKNHAAPAAQSVQFNTQAVGPVSFKLRADAAWIQPGNMLGTVSAKTPASLSISVDQTILQNPGTYSSTVTAAPVSHGNRGGGRGSVERGRKHHAEHGGAERRSVVVPD